MIERVRSHCMVMKFTLFALLKPPQKKLTAPMKTLGAH